MVIFDNISIKYYKELVLSNFSLDIDRGEKISLSGPSGCGKSSLLHLLLGFVAPHEGTVTVNNSLLTPKTVKRVRSQIAWLPQELSFDVKYCREMVLFPFQFAVNAPNSPTNVEIGDLLEQLLLDPKIMDKEMAEISGGQKQRLMLASVLLLKKSIILLDEPTSALDSESTNALANIIHALKDTTIISSSHDPLWNNKMDRIINLKNV